MINQNKKDKILEKGTIEVTFVNRGKDGNPVKRTVSGTGEEVWAASRGYKTRKNKKWKEK